MTRNSLKMQQHRIKWLFWSLILYVYVFCSEKTDGIVKNVKFLSIDLFCDVTNPRFTPKLPQITLNSPKMQ